MPGLATLEQLELLKLSSYVGSERFGEKFRDNVFSLQLAGHTLLQANLLKLVQTSLSCLARLLRPISNSLSYSA